MTLFVYYIIYVSNSHLIYVILCCNAGLLDISPIQAIEFNLDSYLYI
jgi:hypothetical protein